MMYAEVDDTHGVTIIKGAGNVTEQTIVVAVNLVQTVPPGSGFDVATSSDENGDNDLLDSSVLAFIPPGDDRITVPVSVFGDELVENTEAAQLTLEVPTDVIGGEDPPPRFELLPEFPTFLIVIIDDDRKLLCVVACFTSISCMYMLLMFSLISYRIPYWT